MSYKWGEVFRDSAEGPEMVVIPGGEFWMGSREDDVGRNDWERPRHKVAIDYQFAVGRFAVTFDEWDMFFAEAGPSRLPYFDNSQWRGPRGRRAVEAVSWLDAQQYVLWLSEKSGKAYRLLSESEWEYCARAGSQTAYPFGDDPSEAEKYVWMNARQNLVGQKLPNAFGLYDMHGSVDEYVEDCWHDCYEGAPIDGSAWAAGGDGIFRVTRGSPFEGDARILRSAHRRKWFIGNTSVGVGFRVARAMI